MGYIVCAYFAILIATSYAVAPWLGVNQDALFVALSIASFVAVFMFDHIENMISERRKAEEEADRQRWWK